MNSIKENLRLADYWAHQATYALDKGRERANARLRLNQLEHASAALAQIQMLQQTAHTCRVTIDLEAETAEATKHIEDVRAFFE